MLLQTFANKKWQIWFHRKHYKTISLNDNPIDTLNQNKPEMNQSPLHIVCWFSKEETLSSGVDLNVWTRIYSDVAPLAILTFRLDSYQHEFQF